VEWTIPCFVPATPTATAGIGRSYAFVDRPINGEAPRNRSFASKDGQIAVFSTIIFASQDMTEADEVLLREAAFYDG
jgi:hypothetical protein